MWIKALEVVGGIFGGWIGRKNRIAEAEAEARIANAGKVVDNAGWKDEFIVLIWSIPAVLSFVPGFQPYVEQGFANLARAPEWYIVGWVSISLAIYGLKPATTKLVEWRRETNAKE